MSELTNCSVYVPKRFVWVETLGINSRVKVTRDLASGGWKVSGAFVDVGNFVEDLCGGDEWAIDMIMFSLTHTG